MIRRLAWFALTLALTLSATTIAGGQGPQRIVSLVPNLTQILFAIGAGPRVVGVSNYDREPAEVTRLPRVGGLVDPDTERILVLRPDLVVVYDAQQELRQRLEQARVPAFSYGHKDLAHVLATIRAIGEKVGARESAERLAGTIERKLTGVGARVKGRPRPSVLLVFGREPQSLRNIYVNGGYGFLHDMVGIAGGRDVFEDVKRENVQASTEMILARQPEVIIEWLAPPGDHADMSVWRTLSSLPAVKTNRIYQVVGDRFVEAGPYVADATEQLARFIHPEAWAR